MLLFEDSQNACLSPMWNARKKQIEYVPTFFYQICWVNGIFWNRDISIKHNIVVLVELLVHSLLSYPPYFFIRNWHFTFETRFLMQWSNWLLCVFQVGQLQFILVMIHLLIYPVRGFTLLIIRFHSLALGPVFTAQISWFYSLVLETAPIFSTMLDFWLKFFEKGPYWRFLNISCSTHYFAFCMWTSSDHVEKADILKRETRILIFCIEGVETSLSSISSVSHNRSFY